MENDNDEYWQKTLVIIKADDNRLATLLKLATPKLDNNILILKFKFPFHARRVAQSTNIQRITKEVSAVLGRQIKVTVALERAKTGINMDNVESPVVEDKTERIFLKQMHISNFRVLDNIDISFKPNINVILGENNAGKTAVIDALRLALQVGKYKKGVYVSIDDFNDRQSDIEIDLYFSCPKNLKGLFELKVLDKETNTTYLAVHVRYSLIGTGLAQQIRQKFWGGNNEGHKLDEEIMDSFSHEYLGALRDAKAMLKPSSRGKIAELLMNLRTTPEAREKIEKIFSDAQKNPEIKSLVDEATGSVQAHLSKIALSRDEFKVNLDPLPPEFEELVGSFEMKLLKEALLHSVSQNGLGYNNILYASTVLGHVKKAQEIDPDRFHALLIEEPEAHLHPQLEDSLFSYLSDLGSSIGSQIISTTHSPIISSTVDIDNLIILVKKGKNVRSFSLSSIALDKKESRKISRYLDVTKSRMFFAKGVIFVEGITECLLLPKLADIYFGSKNSLISKGIEVVNINGVSFQPYAKLFNDPKNFLPLRASILTDRDSGYVDKLGVTHDKSPRAENAESLKGNQLSVELSEKTTFECDLWHCGNSAIMKKIGEQIFTSSTINTPEELLKKIDNSKLIGKGEFAQEIAEAVDVDGVKLAVPEYIQNAFKWVSQDASD